MDAFLACTSGATSEGVDILDNTTEGPWIEVAQQVEDTALYVILFWNVLCLLTVILSVLLYFYIIHPKPVYIKNDKKAPVDSKKDQRKIKNILKIGEQPDIYVVHLSGPLSDKKNG
ncbi:uncharacterized protein LOC116165470 isoform X2 [Photinus pyralis]|uniref:uncharacterized protein LOC116165470 isoform X2 n=1 Tax=Photinus pyralis TaxID=7054 RepID=UPI0012671B62|nr:uncharacterized protein LOC116165470 isoform X2 [Photinus pyralis]